MTALHRLRREATEIARRIASREAAYLAGLDPDRWNSRWWPQYQDPELRVDMHRDALLALAAVTEPGPDQLGHVSDWLRLEVSLMLVVRLPFIGGLRSTIVGETRQELANLAGAQELLATYDALVAELPAAIRNFSMIARLNKIEDFTGSAIERYWDASAQAAALFTIDWASFGREDLFEATGRRTAGWLVDEGYAGPAAHVLQIGCGIGRIERHLSPHVARVFGVDISMEMIKLGRARLADLANVTLVHGDGRNLPFPDRSMTAVFSFLVFIHIHDPSIVDHVLREAFRVLVPGGRFAITINARDEALEDSARRAGFSVLRTAPVPSRRINSFAYQPDWLLELVRPS